MNEAAPETADSLSQQVKKTQAFFAPDNLADLILKYEGEIALLVIDVQKWFCDPAGDSGNKQTDIISERIQSAVPDFRKAGIPVYAVYYSAEGEKPADQIDFYKFSPDANDTLVAKQTDSAFKTSNIGDLLKNDGRRLLLTCGFNEAFCVKDTVLDARKAGFEVCVLSDLTGNCNLGKSVEFYDDARYEMKRTGAARASSQAVLGRLAPG